MSADSSPQVFTDVSVDPFVRGLLHRPANAQRRRPCSDPRRRIELPGSAADCISGNFCRGRLHRAALRSALPSGSALRPAGTGRRQTRSRRTEECARSHSRIRPRGRVFLGGHSYGGRQASMLCAETRESPEEAASWPALLLLSYPLHPPRKPEQLRTQHFFHLHTPALFVQGTRDPFGSIAEIEQALKLIPAKTKLLTVEGAGHDLGFKGKAGREELSARRVVRNSRSFSRSEEFRGLIRVDPW